MIRDQGYAYAPLARRMDNDRLYRAIRDSSEFSDVWPWGSGPQKGRQSVYKTTPWTHLNCYKLLCMLPGDKQKWDIGVTDNHMEDIVQSSSGARLYVGGPPAKFAQARQVLLKAVSLLPETDIDLANAAIRVEWGGREHAWGKIRLISFGQLINCLRRRSGAVRLWKTRDRH